MGMNSNVFLEVKAFNEEAVTKVKSIDLSEYYLDGWEEDGELDLYCRTEDMAYGRNDFRELMSKIGEALGENGKAYLSEVCMDDVPKGIVYFYLGEKVRYKKFNEFDFEFYEDEDTNEWPDCEDDIFVPSIEWDPSYVAYTGEKEKLTKTEISILAKSKD